MEYGVIEALHGLNGRRLLCSDDDTVRFEEVLDCVSLGDEVGVAHHIEVQVGLAVINLLLDDVNDLERRSHGNSRFEHKRARLIDALPKHPRNVVDGSEIGRSVLVRCGVDGAEDIVDICKSLGKVADKTQTSLVDIGCDGLFQSRLIDGY